MKLPHASVSEEAMGVYVVEVVATRSSSLPLVSTSSAINKASNSVLEASSFYGLANGGWGMGPRKNRLSGSER